MTLDYRSRWQQRRQERASRHRLVVIALVVVGVMGVLAVGNSRRVFQAPSFALPSIGPSWLTPVGGELLVCHREGRLTRLDAELSPTVSTWARPFTHPAGFTGRAAVAGERAFVSCADARLRAVDLRTGLQKWETVVGASVAEPTASGDAVFFGSDDGTLYAVGADNGSVRWLADLGARIGSAPLVSEERVVVGTVAGVLHCLERGSGTKLWRATLGGPIYASPRQVGEAFVVGTDDGVIYRIDPDGKPAGQFSMDGLVRAPVAVAGDVVVVGDSQGTLCRIEAGTMAEVWRRRLAGPVTCAPLVDGDRVWCAAGVDVVGLRAATGAQVWRHHGANQTVDCALADGQLYWTTADGRVHKETVRR